MTFFKFLSLFFISAIYASFSPSDFSVVFIETEETIPKHLDKAISQLRLFNQTTPIFVAAHEKTLKNYPKRFDVIFLPLEKMKKSSAHQKYLHHQALVSSPQSKTAESLFYLEEIMIQRHLQNVFQIKSNVLIYSDLNKLLPVCKKNYPGMAATFDNDERCQSSFLYVSHKDVLKKCTDFLCTHIQRNSDPQKVLSLVKEKCGKNILDSLPILPPEYTQEHSLRSLSNRIPRKNDVYWNHIDLFGSLFDPSVMGKYVESLEKEIDPDSVFQPSHCKVVFEKDSEGRKIPFLLYKTVKLPINNLVLSEENIEKYLSQADTKEEAKIDMKKNKITPSKDPQTSISAKK